MTLELRINPYNEQGCQREMMGGPDSEGQLEAVDMAHTFISVGNPLSDLAGPSFF